VYQLYVDELADRAELIVHMVRVLIGFAQVIGNLSGIALSWPKEFYDMARWFDFAKFSFDVPSLACAIQQSGIVEYTFYKRHLLYTVGPLVLIVLIALPSLWARLRRLDAATRDDLDDRRVRWTLFAVFLLYPKAQTRLALPISSAAVVIRANPSSLLQFASFAMPVLRYHTTCAAGLADCDICARLQERRHSRPAGYAAPV
jgi:hypothetical protein